MKDIAKSMIRNFLVATAIGFVGILFAQLAHAATPITEEMALKYYESCLVNAQKEGTMTGISIKSYCFCTANQMKTAMTQEDIVAMSGKNEQAARATVNKVLTDVNAPCTQYPLHDKVYAQCMTSVGAQSTCACLAKNISFYIAEKSQGMMKNILRQNPNIYDPLGAIMETAEYKATEKKITLSCATNPNY